MSQRKRSSSRILAVLAVVVVCSVIGVLGAFGFTQRSKKDVLPPEEPAPSGDPSAVAVTVEPVVYRSVQRSIDAVGTLEPFEQVEISSRIEGRVARILHDVGDRVKPGDVLLEIERTDYELDVRQAQRALEVELSKLGLTDIPKADFDLTGVPSVVQAGVRKARAQERLDRVRDLVQRKVMTDDNLSIALSDGRAADAEYDNQLLLAKSGLAMIQLKSEMLAISRRHLEETTIHVPKPTGLVPGPEQDVAYAVTARTPAEGTVIKTGAMVFKLVLDRPLKLKVVVADRHVPEVREGQPVKVHLAAYSEPFDSTVKRINPAVDPQTRTFEVEIHVPNAEGKLKSGSFAKATILTGTDAEIPTVPIESVVRFAGITKVFLAEEDQARDVPVTLGVSGDRWVEVGAPPLSRDALVVTSGHSFLSDRTPIRVRTPQVADQPDTRQGATQ